MKSYARADGNAYLVWSTSFFRPRVSHGKPKTPKRRWMLVSTEQGVRRKLVLAQTDKRLMRPRTHYSFPHYWNRTCLIRYHYPHIYVMRVCGHLLLPTHLLHHDVGRS